MAKKRFTDVEIWSKEWFMDLSPKLKCLIRYLFDNCDSSGVWTPNWRLASMQIGESVCLDDLKKLPEKQYEILEAGKIFLPDFISFQYGKLSKECRPHVPIIATIEKNGLRERLDDLIEDQGSSVKALRKRLTEQAKREIFIQDDYQCQYCGDRPGSDNLFVDHIVALSDGGNNSPENLITACKSCNSKKHDDNVFQFLRKHDFEPLKNLSKKLDTLYKNSNTLQEKETEKDKEVDKEITFGKSENLLIPKMIEAFLILFPKYPKDQKTDFPALREIAEKIQKTEGFNGDISHNTEHILKRWGEIIVHIKSDNHLSKYSISQVNKHFQSVIQSLSNGSANRTANKSKPGTSEARTNTAKGWGSGFINSPEIRTD